MISYKKVKVLRRAEYKRLNLLSKEDLINMIIQSDINLKSMINDHINTVEKYEEDINKLTNNYFELLSKLIKKEEKHNKASHHINNLLKFIRTLKEEIREKNKTITKLNDSNIRLDIDNVELQMQINQLKEQLEDNNKEHDNDLTRTQNRILNNTKAFLKYYRGTYDDMSRIRSIEKFTNRLVHSIDMMDLYKNKINSADNLERRAKEEIIEQLIDDIKDSIKRHEEEIIIDDIEEEIILEYDEDMELYM